VLRRDPLANPEPLVRRVYAYVAYRIGDGPDAEDVTSDVFEQALRYRSSYDPAKGEPAAWLIGIARRCIASAFAARPEPPVAAPEVEAPGDLEAEALERLSLASALARLGDRDRELIALRYGADLPARQIAKLFETKTNAVEVALHRALKRLRDELERSDAGPPGTDREDDVRIPGLRRYSQADALKAAEEER
jgi:RNA polymerase sigma-70 factor, ECF subfamily